MILLIDNYDSFAHNLARYFVRLGQETVVCRNDEVSIGSVADLKPKAIVISPGPCGPDEAGECLSIVEAFASRIPMLGVCLGHQVIASAMGARVERSQQPMHGRSSKIYHQETSIFQGITNPTVVGRYHSLLVTHIDLPSELKVLAHLENGTNMAFRHRSHPLFGVQFHPESILTPCGYRLLANFLRLAGLGVAETQDLFTSEKKIKVAENQNTTWPNRPVTF